jgi:Peptidase A4 family
MQTSWRWASARTLFISLSLLVAMSAGAATPAPVASAIHAVATNIPGVYAFTQPPAGFNAMTASPAVLAAWGYPPRPAASQGADAMAQWQAAVDPTNIRVIPQFVRHEGVYHRPATDLKLGLRSAGTNTTSATSGNWSGYALTPSGSGEPFYLVTAHWTVPTVQQATHTCSGWDYSSQWVGIGGLADGDLLQAGSAANVFCDAGKDIPEYFPWLEWLPQSELVLYRNAANQTPFPFEAGDYLIVTVWATDFSGGVSTTGNLSFADRTQHWTVNITFSAASVGGSEVTGQSAEWIVERSEVGGSLATLPNYTADPWWGTRAEDLGSANFYPGSSGTAPAYSITMLDNSNAPVSYSKLFGTQSLWFFPEGSAL